MPTPKSSSWRSTLVFGLLLVAAAALVYSFRPKSDAGPIKAPQARSGAMEFSAPDLNGAAWRLSDHRGKVVLLNIFATWCPPCRHETPDLVNLSKKFADQQVAFVGVSMDEGGTSVVQTFVNDYNIPYPVVLPSPDNPLTAHIQAIPVTFLIDRQGRLAKHYVGAIDASTLTHDIEQLLKENT